MFIMSHEIIKNVRVTKDKIVFDHCSSNVFPIRYSHREMPNDKETHEWFKQLLIDRCFQPRKGNMAVYKAFGVTHYFDGTPVE